MKHCKICNLPEYDIEKNIINKFAEKRRVCEKCFKEIKSNYYLKNKDKFKSKYVPRDNPRGRPKKIETEENKKVDETKVLETSNKTNDDTIVNSSK